MDNAPRVDPDPAIFNGVHDGDCGVSRVFMHNAFFLIGALGLYHFQNKLQKHELSTSVHTDVLMQGSFGMQKNFRCLQFT